MPGRLAPCPDRPNCVSSRAQDPPHRVKPFRLSGSPERGWRALQAAVASLPRARIVETAEGYLRAEARSLLFRFVDDLELELDAEAGVIHVRSASRVGRSDLGVNRRRVERLRRRLQREGVVQ